MESIVINNEVILANHIIYVDAINGDDITADGTELNPYKTLEKAVSLVNTYLNSDIVVFMLGDGEYIHSTFLMETPNTNVIKIIGNQNSILRTTSIYPTSTTSNKCLCELEYYRLIFTDDGITASNKLSLKNSKFYNVLFKDNVNCSYGYILSTNSEIIEFYNCVKQSKSNNFIRATGGTAKFTNCIGEFTSGYGTTQINWDYATNIIQPITINAYGKVTNMPVNNLGTGTNPDGTIANIGLYGGLYAWYYSSLKPLTINRTLKNELPKESIDDEIHFTEDGGIYITDNNGHLKKMGVDDETMNKINDLSQNGGVVGDITNNYIIDEMSNPLTMNPLEHGTFKLSSNKAISANAIIPFDMVVNGNMLVPVNGIIRLNKGVTYNIQFDVYATSSTSGSTRFECYNIATDEVLATGAKATSNDTASTISSAFNASITPLENIEIGFRPNIALTTLYSAHTYLNIQEIRNNPIAQYGGFETEILFDGVANTIGNYELVDDINKYNFVYIEGNYANSIVSLKSISKLSQVGYYHSTRYFEHIFFNFIGNTLNISSISYGTDVTEKNGILKVIGIKGQIPSLLVGGEF